MDLSGLNTAQREAVSAADGAHLVVAGAGTGKTRTLVHRVAWLIDQGVAPRDVVLLTFTRRAAQEMLDRCASLVGSRAHGVRGGTFHSFANTALRRHGQAVGLARSFTILDRSDAESLVGLVRTGKGLGGRARRFPKSRTLLNIFSRSVNTGQSIEDILDEEYPQYLDDLQDIESVQEGYEARKRAQQVVDFDDLLVLLAKLLKENVEVRRRIAGRCRHVLVDEFQDTNRLQAQIAALLASVHGNLMVVGDEAQSIYGFRGARVENILEFPQMFEGTKVTLLEQNYRSVQPVLDLANAVLESAETGYDKRLRSDIPDGDLPVLVSVSDDSEQADTVVQQVLALREEGVELTQQAVLFRSSAQANLLEVALTEAGIPYRKFGGIKFVEAAHIKDVFALLRIVANPRDVLAWIRVLSWFEGLGAKTAAKIGTQISESSELVLDPGPYERRKYGASLKNLAELLYQAGQLEDDLMALMELLVTWYREPMKRLYEDHKRRVKDLDTLGVLAERYVSLESFLAEVALDPIDRSEADAFEEEDEGYLTLSTIHSAKGLEWHTVYILALNNGAFPSGYALDDPEQIEEERRLFYVAVTRAKRNLYLLRPRFLRARWGAAVQPGCELLDEIEELDDLVDEGSPGLGGLDMWAPPPQGASEEERLARLLDYFS